MYNSGLRMNLKLEGSEMAEKTILEKAGNAVGFGIAMVEDLAGTVKAAVGTAVNTVTGVLKTAPATNLMAKKSDPRNPAKKAAKVVTKKTTKKALAKKTARKALAIKAVAKAPSKRAAKKVLVRKDPAKKAVKKSVSKAANSAVRRR
jgi:hypothetical protein